ncbi:MAG: hypothetical protein ACOZNI_21095 [Myxococcota bacterium]
MLVLLLFALAPSRAVAADGTPGASAVANAPVPAAWLDAYDATREALVEDRHADAAASARLLAGLADPEIALLAGKVAGATDEAARRAAFGELSRALVLRISAAGGPKVYAYHCPMITTGYAYWIQSATGIGNPYMGRSMPECGEGTSMKAAVKAATPK